MAEEFELHSPNSRKGSGSSGFFEIPLTPEFSPPTTPPPVQDDHHDMLPAPPSPNPASSSSEHHSVRKPTSLKKKNSDGAFDGVLHMGWLWCCRQKADKKSSEEIRFTSKEEKLSRIFRMNPRENKQHWKRYFAIVYSDGRFAWYTPGKITLYNRKPTGELEEVLFIPWRVCAFGSEVTTKFCGNIEINDRPASAPVSPKLLGSSPPSFTAILESATACICGSPSLNSLITNPPPYAIPERDPEAVPCISRKKNREELLIAIGGQDWSKGDVYIFATDTESDLDLWKESISLLSHRKIVERSAFDHLLNTPVIITLPFIYR